METNFIKLSNELYDSYSLTNEEVCIYILLQRNYMIYKDLGLSSISLLIQYMYINTHNNKNIFNNIKDTLVSLIKKQYVQKLYDIYYNEIVVEDIKDKNYFFYVKLSELPTDKYFMVYDEELNIIFKHLSETNIDKFNFIRYFIATRRVTNNERNFGYLSQTKMKELIRNSSTVTRYNELLHSLKLIRYCSDYITKDKHYCTTYIANYEDTENAERLFYESCDIEASANGLVKTDKTKSNKKRSTKQKINNVEGKISSICSDEIDRIKLLEIELAELKSKYQGI